MKLLKENWFRSQVWYFNWEARKE